MKRRLFTKQIGFGTSAALMFGQHWSNAMNICSDNFPELKKHKITKCELIDLDYHWPRFVGKNGQKDFHGQNKKCKALNFCFLAISMARKNIINPDTVKNICNKIL